MGYWFRLTAIGTLAAAVLLACGPGPATAQPRAHVYLFRGLADVFSTGMDTLADELNKHGVYATSHSHTDWKDIADKAAADYKARKEGPIIIIGHSLGADAAMEMADYLGDKAVPVALVIPFDGTQSFPAPGNVGRVINFTQREYAFMRPGPGFRGSLQNVDLSFRHDIDHLTIDKAPDLHARVLSEVLAVVGGHPPPRTVSGPPAAPADSKAKVVAPSGETDAERSRDAIRPTRESGTPVIAQPEKGGEKGGAESSMPAPVPQPKPMPPRPPGPAQIPD